MAVDFIEALDPVEAQKILGSQYDPNYSYTLVTLPDRFVINQKSKETGAETEIVLEDTPMKEDEDVGKTDTKYPPYKYGGIYLSLLPFLVATIGLIVISIAILFIYLTWTGEISNFMSKVVATLAKS